MIHSITTTVTYHVHRTNLIAADELVDSTTDIHISADTRPYNQVLTP